MTFLLFRKITVRPLQQPKMELLADPKRSLVHLQYPLQIEWKEPLDFLFDLRFQRELITAGNEFFWKEYPEGGWGPALRMAQEQKERASLGAFLRSLLQVEAALQVQRLRQVLAPEVCPNGA